MRLYYRAKYEGEIKTLKLKKDPFKYGIGYYEDIDGVTWDVESVVGGNYSSDGEPYINARMVDNSPYYSTATNGNSYGCHTWIPYKFEVIPEEVKN